jgi:hypothetical protein
MQFFATVLPLLALGASAWETSPTPSGIERRAASATFPNAAGYSALSKAMTVTGTFDGKMKRFDRGGMLALPRATKRR